MADRPDPSEFDRPLSPDELRELHRRMCMLSPYHVAHTYREAYARCRMEGDVPPKATALQELVTAWKILWKRRDR